MKAREMQRIVALLCIGRSVDPFCNCLFDILLELDDNVRAELIWALFIVQLHGLVLQMLGQALLEIIDEVFDDTESIIVRGPMQQVIPFIVHQVRQILN